MKDESGWDEYFLQLSQKLPSRSSDSTDQSGSVLVSQSHRILSIGFNGSPFGGSKFSYDSCPFGFLGKQKDSSESLPIDPPCHHSEYNAIIKAHKEDRAGSTIYLTHRPCTECHELILREGIKMMVWTTPDGRIAREKQYH